MRGVIEVVDPAQPDAPLAAPASPPLYQQLNIDIDAMHPAENLPAARPSAERGALIAASIPARLTDKNYLRSHSPSQVWAELRAEATLQKYPDSGLWDAVAWLWKGLATDDAVLRGQKTFAQDCAACHGETGRGDGPAGKNLPGLTAMHPEMKRGPADFTDAAQMLGASDVLLQGKILRGGMGSGMPEWGSLYQADQMWDLIAYLRTFTLGR
jgi:mono/diheme cytochrome c family protein